MKTYGDEVVGYAFGAETREAMVEFFAATYHAWSALHVVEFPAVDRTDASIRAAAAKLQSDGRPGALRQRVRPKWYTSPQRTAHGGVTCPPRRV